MTSPEPEHVPAVSAEALFRDVVDVHAARRDLDRALLEALTAPGLGESELARVVALAQGSAMHRGRAAFQRLQQATGEAYAPRASSAAQEIS